MNLPLCLGPIRMSNMFVLVGDHKQLPPLMKSKEIGNVNTSLFHRLSENHPQSLILLKKQYRMNSDIMSISNKFIYDNNLQCGNVMIAESKLNLKELNSGLKFLMKFDKSKNLEINWIEKVLDPQRKVIFINTDGIPALDSKVAEMIINEIEADLVSQVIVLIRLINLTGFFFNRLLIH